MIEVLYLHLPFCVSRCAYCDFATSACDDGARMDAYVEALCLQLRRAAKAGLLGQVKTIYIGGGTPTHLGSRRLNTLVYTLSLSVNLENVVEFTCEANPESIDERMVADLFSLGVNRFSIGAQSFDDAVLRGYGRVHDAAAIDAALAAVHTRTNNVSLDLICGGPGQSMESWRKSLRHAIDAGVSHVSVYPLMLEDDTPLVHRVEMGECEVADEDAQADMMLEAEQMLTVAGFERYEVASYAKPGFTSRRVLSTLASGPGHHPCFRPKVQNKRLMWGYSKSIEKRLGGGCTKRVSLKGLASRRRIRAEAPVALPCELSTVRAAAPPPSLMM